MEPGSTAFTFVSKLLATEFPGEVHTLVQLPQEEGANVLRQIIRETKGLGSMDTADRIADKLRDALGLTRGDTETVDILSPESSDRFDALCAAMAL
jgi:hypothetical protein